MFPAAPSNATCALHPSEVAVFTCARCGSFACGQCGEAGPFELCARCRAIQQASLKVGYFEAIGDGWRLFRKAGARLLPLVPALLAIATACEELELGNLLKSGWPEEDSPAAVPAMLVAILRALVVLGAMGGVASALRTALLVPLFVDADASGFRSARARLTSVLPRLPALVVTDVLLGSAAAIGLASFCAPGFLLATYFVFTEQLIVVESRAGLAALRQSPGVVRRNARVVLGLIATLALVSLASAWIGTGLARALHLETMTHVRAVAAGAWSTLQAIVSCAVFTALYLRLRPQPTASE